MKLPPPGAPIPAVERARRGPFDAVVFAGGGCRCFWQSGFWAVAAPALGLRPEVVAAVSAGAAFACAALVDAAERVLDDFKRRAAANPRNAYPGNAWRREPVFPHESMYRAALLAGLEGVDWSVFRTGPDLRILLARAPHWAGDRAGFLIGSVAYALDRFELRVHPRWGSRLGFVPEVVSARDCPDPESLVALILQSSCTPPLLPLYRRGGRIVLDGGLVDNAPASWVGEGRSTLVLLTRDYPADRLPRVPGRTYVAPSERIPIVKWDYASPGLMQATFDLGRRDGEAFVRAREAVEPAPAAAPVTPPEPARLAG